MRIYARNVNQRLVKPLSHSLFHMMSTLTFRVSIRTSNRLAKTIRRRFILLAPFNVILERGKCMWTTPVKYFDTLDAESIRNMSVLYQNLVGRRAACGHRTLIFCLSYRHHFDLRTERCFKLMYLYSSVFQYSTRGRKVTQSLCPWELCTCARP